MSTKISLLSGGIWTGISSAVALLTQLLRVIILTRFLEKSDFGTVAIINMIIGFCLCFADLGFSSVIMYKQELSRKEFSSIYWLQFILYIIIFIILSAVSPLFSLFYEDNDLNLLIPLSSLSVVFLAIGKLHESVLQKKYEFISIAIRNIISNTTSLILSLLLAYKGFGIYSLVISTLFQSIFYNVWSLCAGVRYQPVSLCLEIKKIKPFLKIGIYQTYTRIADYLSSQIDVFIIGKILGTEVLGMYDLAKQLVYRLVTFVRMVMSQIALPVLTNANECDEEVKKRFLYVTKVVAYICTPLCMLLIVFSKEIIYILYGESYVEAAPVVIIFSLISLISSVTSLYDMLGIAKGRTDLNFRNTVFRILLTLPLITIASYFGMTFVALAYLITAIIGSVYFWNIVLMKTYPMSLIAYTNAFSRYVLTLALFSVLFIGGKYLLNQIFDLIPQMQICINVVVYLVMLVSLCLTVLRSDFIFLYNLIKKK